MKAKTFILMFMMMFCSITFGQMTSTPWGDYNPRDYEYSMNVTTAIFMDGVEMTDTDLELGVFYDGQLRGSGRLIASPNASHPYLVPLTIHGNETGDVDFLFKLFDHKTNSELPYSLVVTMKASQDMELGNITNPFLGIDFISVAETNGVKFGTLKAAVEAAQAGQTVTLLVDAAGAGVVIDKSVTIDFNGKTYTANEGVGSAGTESNGFQILNGNTVVLKNGTFVAGDGIKMLVQNYADLTVADMTLNGTSDIVQYVLSNNSGNVDITGATNITANANGVAFDVYDYTSGGYPQTPVVNVNTTGTITGKIEVSATINEQLNIKGGKFTQELQKAWCVEGYVPVKDGEYWTVVEGAIQVTYADNTVAYFSEMIDAVPYGNDAKLAGATITLLGDCEGKGMRFWQNGMTLDLGGYTYTITEATGSTGTESQGFQIRPEVTGKVTIKNGSIAIAENTNVKWMFNSYAADFVVENVTIDGANIVTSTDEDYLLVVQDAGDKATFTDVVISDYDAKKVYLEGNTTFVAPQDFGNIEIPTGYVLVYENGMYKVQGAIAKIGETIYPSVKAAVAAAQAGNTIELLADVTENVTINKNVTLDGAEKNYTGTMTISNGKTVTVQNVNFVKGCIDKSKGTSGTLTVKGCKFDGVDGSINYAVTMRGGNTVTIEGGDVKNYGYGMLYVPSAVSNVNVKGTTVDGVNYGVHVAYGSKVNIDSVTMTNVAYGIMTQNYGAKTITIKNSSISGTNPIYVWERNTTVTDTFNFEGANIMHPGEDYAQSLQAKFVLTATDATLTAPEGFNVTTTVEGYKVDYTDGKYFLRLLDYVAQIGDVKYETLQAAIDAAAVEGDVINVIKDHTYDCTNVKQSSDGPAIAIVEGKDVTIDFCGKTITVDATNSEYTTGVGLIAVIHLQNGGGLTVKDSSANAEGGINAIAGDKKIYSVITTHSTSTKLVIENGNYRLDATSAQNLIYGAIGNITVNGGNFYLGNATNDPTTAPWIFNVRGNGGYGAVTVNGGNYNVRPEHHQGEIYIAKEFAIAQTTDATYPYSVVPAVARIEETGFASIADAVDAANDGDEIIVVADHEMNAPVVVEKNLTLNLNGKAITGDVYPVVRIQSGANVTVTGEGSITNGDYVFVLGASDGSSNGYLTIENGMFVGETTVASVTKGLLTIEGGEFKVTNDATYLINCIDANYKEGTASVSITGGTFHKWNPENNAAEGVGTNFCAEGYVAEYNAVEDTYTVRKADYVAQISEAKYETLQAAIDAAVDGDEIIVLKDITLGTDNTTQFAASEGTPVTALNIISAKSVTIDLNGKKLYCEEEAEGQLYNFFAITDQGHLTLKDSSDDKQGTVEIAEASSSVYSLIICYDGTMIIENGNYKLEYGRNGGGMIYSAQDETVTVNGGNFWLGNAGTLENYSPWIFNASGRNTSNIIVNGGTFNADVLHQYYAFEVSSSVNNAIVNNGNGTWSVITEGAVAYVTERYYGNSLIYPSLYINSVGYATLEDAFAAAHTYNYVTEEGISTVTMLKDVIVDAPIVVNAGVKFDMAAKTVTAVEDPAVYPVIRIQNGASLTVTGEGSIINNVDYVFVLGASDGSSEGYLTIENGMFVGETTVASVTKGLLTIEGGEFKVTNDATYLINCIDANYKEGTASVSITGGTFHKWNPENNAAEGVGTNFCAEGYGAVENPANVWTVMPTQKMALCAGWNWFSSYIEIEGTAGMEQLQSSLSGNATVIKSQLAYTNYYTGGENAPFWNGGLKESSVEEMYMINMTADHDMQLSGIIVDPSEHPITLKSGWTWIGYPMNQTVSLNDALADIDAQVGDHIKGHGAYAEYYEGYGWWGSLKNLEPGKGYIYHNVLDNPVTFTYSYPAEGSRSEARANVTSENNYWVPASSQYANNMTITAIVEGVDSDYEVAAFVNGEVHGSARPIYVEPIDAYMLFLTIHGEDVEEMTFKMYDLATGEEYALNDRMNYSNDAIVGSIREPYVFTRGTTGIGEASLGEVNIYPNPTTIGREINLEATCEMVEVFNALGVKVAEYHNVDSIDAFDTAGIYVIRLTNNGDVKHCRLVVK